MGIFKKWLSPRKEKKWKIVDTSHRGILYHIYKHRERSGRILYGYRIDFGSRYDVKGKWMTEAMAHHKAMERIDYHIDGELYDDRHEYES